MSFSDLGLKPELLRAVADKGYDTPSPIQIQAIPAVLGAATYSAGAQTGTRQNRRFRPAPSCSGSPPPWRREIARAARAHPCPHPRAGRASCAKRARLRQVRAASRHAGVRRCEHQSADQRIEERLRHSGGDTGSIARLAQQRAADLSKIDVLVLDEADRMLDMGFIHDIRRIIKLLPAKRQRTCCSRRPTPTTFERSRSASLTRCRFKWRLTNAPIELVEQRAYRVHKDRKRRCSRT